MKTIWIVVVVLICASHLTFVQTPLSIIDPLTRGWTLTADEKKIGLEVFNANGQLLDLIGDLLEARKK